MLLTTVTLYSTLIPISLYVSIELIKYLQVGLGLVVCVTQTCSRNMHAGRCENASQRLPVQHQTCELRAAWSITCAICKA